MSRRKLLNRLAHAIESFHFAGDVCCAVLAPSNIKRHYSEVVSGDEEVAGTFVEESERKNATQHIAQGWSVLVIEIQDNLAVRLRFPGVRPVQGVAQCDMIVDLSVHSQRPTRGNVEKGLGAVLNIDDGKAFVREHCAFAGIDATPVRPAVSNRLCHLQRAAACRFKRFRKFEYADEAAQGDNPSVCRLIYVTTISARLEPQCLNSDIEFAS